MSVFMGLEIYRVMYLLEMRMQTEDRYTWESFLDRILSPRYRDCIVFPRIFFLR